MDMFVAKLFDSLKNTVCQFWSGPLPFTVLKTLAAVLILACVYRLVRHSARKLLQKRFRQTTVQAAETIIRYAFWAIGVMYVLGQFGVKLNALLGAAGIAGIAVGFAAQTSVSNIISGFFVLTEKSLKIGDAISVDGITGIVYSIELLSVKLKTYDGQMVRVPNETIIKSNLINFSFFPLRRVGIAVTVAHDTDLQLALETLKAVPAQSSLILRDPAPACVVDSFGESGVSITLYVWFKRENYFAAKNEIAIAVQRAFAERGIEIPVHRIDVRTK
jgi:small-conductance mechanosensitive channel